jgi:hypothetical protein
MADPILTKAVLEMFVNPILFSKIGKIGDVLCRDSISRRNKMILCDPYPVRIPNSIKL